MTKHKYDYITKDITWSYSNASTFQTCPYAWYLTYIMREERGGNFFSDYGLLVHETLEKFWDGMGIWELEYEYQSTWSNYVTHELPPFLQRALPSYYEKGLKFFSEIDWDRNRYEVLGNETTIDCTYKDVKLTIRPDLIIKDKTDGIVILADYKSGDPFTKTGKIKKKDEEKIEGYWKQLSLYAYFVEREQGYNIEKLRIYFPKVGVDSMIEIEYNKDVGQAAVDWWYSTVVEARESEVFPPKTETPKKDEDFFCNHICSVRDACKHMNGENSVKDYF